MSLRLRAMVRRSELRSTGAMAPSPILLTHDTGFAPSFDVATAVADYLAWRADNPC
jgi:hypothetical protein